jgi:hypothetical protein
MTREKTPARLARSLPRGSPRLQPALLQPPVLWVPRQCQTALDRPGWTHSETTTMYFNLLLSPSQSLWTQLLITLFGVVSGDLSTGPHAISELHPQISRFGAQCIPQSTGPMPPGDREEDHGTSEVPLGRNLPAS